jgi:HNH endonuclease
LKPPHLSSVEKEKTVEINHLVVIEGWGHPKLETHTIQQSGTTVYDKAKFHAFSHEWDDLLDQYLASLGSHLKLILDGRKRPKLTRIPERSSLSLDVKTPSMSVTFASIKVGSKWDRKQLAELWGYNGRQGLDHGIVTPKNDNKIILFITHEKQSHSKQFTDMLEGNTVQMDGQPSHRTDDRLIQAAERGDEIHLFYRDRPLQPFTYFGKVYLQSHEIHTDQSSKFTFHLPDQQKETQQPPFDPINSTINDIPSAPIGCEAPGRTPTNSSRYQRDDKVRSFVIEQAKGICEYCNELGFLRPDGTHYLEAHHIIALADQGPDEVGNVIALCPSDHREAHYGKNAVAIENEMIKKRQSSSHCPKNF